MAEWVLQRERGLSWQWSQACFPAACHHPNGRPSLGAPQGAPDPRDYRGTLQRKSQGNWVWKKEPINYPHSLIPPMAVEALGSGDRKVAQDPLWPFSCLQPGLQLSQKGVWGGQCRLPRLQSHLQESDIFPEESQPWLSLCSLPWGGRVVFKVKVSARLHFELPPPLCP